MDLRQANAEVFIPDGVDVVEGLERTTHLAIGAHHDDLEIMAIEGILTSFGEKDKWFSGVVVTDGGGSPRAGQYESYSDEEMKQVRVVEQKKAAVIGEYGAQVFLGYPSSAVKDPANKDVVADIVGILRNTKPEVVYIHNLADKHETHVATAIKALKAIWMMEKEERPKKLFGCEVWRDLGWMMDDEKIVFDCSEQMNLQEALVGVFDSQISGGKRYDLATMGRRMANATYFSSHATDEAKGLVFGMDLTPLMEDDAMDVAEYVVGYIDRFADDVRGKIRAAIV